jgi:hypothetical protein
VNEKTGEYSLGDGNKYTQEDKTTHAPSLPPPEDPLKYIREVCGKFARPIAQSTGLADPLATLDLRLKAMEVLFTTPSPSRAPSNVATRSPTSTPTPTLCACVCMCVRLS